MDVSMATAALSGGRAGLLIAGAIVGFLVAVPVGPVAVLAVRRTLLEGRAAGWCTGLGAAAGDTAFGALALFGVAALEDALLDRRAVLQGVGGALLLGLGLATVLARHRRAGQAAPAADGASLAGAFGSAFVVTAVNPITALVFVAIFAAMGVTEATGGLADPWTALVVLAGVFAGAAAWWFLLVAAATVLRRSFTEAGLARMNAVCGAAIAGFGVWGLAAALWP